MMSGNTLPVVARQQWWLFVRDNRLAVLGTALLLIILAALAGAAVSNARQNAHRAAAQSEEAQIWALQDEVNPHSAAHFGRYVFKPLSPLAALDPGLLPQLGTALRLEAHAQNPATGRAVDQSVALDRFAGLSAAAILQILAPLIVILAGFTSFAGDRARLLLKQELASGVTPMTLMLGRAIGLCGLVLCFIALVLVAGGVLLVSAGAPASDYQALLLMAAGYALYLLTFAVLTLAISALFASARTALVVLLAFWAIATLFVPRIAPAVAEAAVPTLSGPAFEAAVTEEVQNGPDGHDPRDQRLARLRAEMLSRYNVSRIEDLPVDFGGISLFHGEALSSAVYRRHFAALYDGYDRQARLQRRFAALSPMMALRPWSAALAGSDQHSHRRLLEQAETYRYTLIQQLNRDIIHNRKDGSAPYLANVPDITGNAVFNPRPAPLGELLRRQLTDLFILLGWLAVAAAAALIASRRLGRSIA